MLKLSRFAVLALFSSFCAQAQDGVVRQLPDAAFLLEQSAHPSHLFRQFRSIQYQDDITEEVDRGHPLKMLRTTVVKAASPTKYRIENVRNMGYTIIFGNGQDGWTYFSLDNFYLQRPLPSFDRDGPGDQLGPLSGAKVIRSDRLDVDGKKHDCWVVECNG